MSLGDRTMNNRNKIYILLLVVLSVCTVVGYEVTYWAFIPAGGAIVVMVLYYHYSSNTGHSRSSNGPSYTINPGLPPKKTKGERNREIYDRRREEV